MNTAKLYEFRVLADTLNYSKAAKILFISQSILSRHIQDLEEELGVTLFVRSTHGVQLTEVGRMLALRSQELIERCDAAQSRLLRRSVKATGRISIGICLEYSYSGQIRDFFTDFSGRYGDIELIYDVLPGSVPPQTACQYDLLFSPCDYPTLPENINRFHVMSHSTQVLLPPGHPLMSSSSVYLHQLARQTIVVPHADELFGPYAQNYVLVEKATRGQVGSIRVDNLPTALFLVSMGKGICIAPSYAQNLAPRETFHVTVSDRACRFEEYLYYNDQSNSAAQLFFDEFTMLMSQKK